jgi:15-cis-phytoene synthase
MSYTLPREAVFEFCLGMRHDLVNATIETEDDLERYCEHVAGTVGLMLTAMFGSSHRSTADDMATLGRAMQRTNILRDIDEDLEHGRVYIARTTIERFGHPAPGQRERLLRDQIARADALYDEGRVAIERLLHGREAMGLSISLYQEILRQIECEGYGRLAGRASVPEWRKREIARPYASDSATS